MSTLEREVEELKEQLAAASQPAAAPQLPKEEQEAGQEVTGTSAELQVGALALPFPLQWSHTMNGRQICVPA